MDGWERRGAVIRHARESGDDVAAATDGVKETTTRDGQAEGERVACTAQVRYHTTSLEEDRKAPAGCGDAGHVVPRHMAPASVTRRQSSLSMLSSTGKRGTFYPCEIEPLNYPPTLSLEVMGSD